MAHQNLAFRSKKQVVYDYLRGAVLDGTLSPGTRLVIDELAGQLGVSPIPVREALQQLEADGFIVIKPYVGATVTEIHADLIYEIFALLQELEVLSGRVACRRMSDADLAEMETIVRGMDGLTHDLDRFSQENKRLHQFICVRAGTGLVQSLASTVLDHWDRLRRYYLNDVFAHRVADAQEEHWRLLAALRLRDSDRVEHVVREHNRLAQTAYTDHLHATGQIPLDLGMVYSKARATAHQSVGPAVTSTPAGRNTGRE